MPHKQDPIKMTEAEYLAFERESDIKHEYINGTVYAMAGGTREHIVITGNTFATLHSQRRKHGCEVYQSEMRVRVSSLKYVYPDVTVSCGTPEFTDDDRRILLNPHIVIEVLSPSTEAFDRGGKFQFYRNIPSIQHYLLISQDTPRIEGFSRQSSGLWTFKDTNGLNSTFEIETFNFTLNLRDIYEQIIFETSDSDDDS